MGTSGPTMSRWVVTVLAVSCHLALGMRVQDSTRTAREAFDLGDAQDMLLSMESDLGEGKGEGGACHKSCATGKCVGTDRYHCTACPTGRMLDPEQNTTSGLFMKYGMCTDEVCHPTCLEGKCIGPKSYQCTACEADKVLEFVVDRHGKKADYGQCQLCAKTCVAGKCVGSGSDECTECYEDKALVLRVGFNNTKETFG